LNYVKIQKDWHCRKRKFWLCCSCGK